MGSGPVASGRSGARAVTGPAPGFQVTRLGGAATAYAEAWNRLARRGHHLHRWFVAAEAGPFQPRHLEVKDALGLRAIIPAYLERGGLHGDLHDRWLGPARGPLAALGVRLRPSIAAVLPLGTASEPLGDVAALPDETIHAVFNALEEQARVDGARAVVWPFVTADQAALLRVAEQRGYARAFAGSTARIRVEWNGFDEYVASRSRNVRRTIRHELRRLREAGIDLRAGHDFRSAAPAAGSLYRDGFKRRNGYPPSLEVDFFARVAEQADESLWAQTAWQGDALIGASLNMVAGGRVDGGMAGFAPSAVESAVFAADLVYEPVRIACERGYRTIELGPTALQAKLLRGAVLVPRYTIVRGTNRTFHSALLPLAAVVDAWTRRKERRALGRFLRPEGHEYVDTTG
jgi:predicted N-acyltransferase